MSKVILVIDNSDECRNCPCFNGFYFGGYCGVINKEIEYDYDNCVYTKPDWCPLKEAPEYQFEWYDDERSDWERGYNNCLDDILGKED